MDTYKKIAVDTNESSLNDLHKKIFELLKTQPEASKELIEQLIDYYQKIILCMPGNVYWMDRDCLTVGCNQRVLDMFGMDNISEFEHLSFEDMARIGSWSESQGESFKQDSIDVINNGIPKLNVEEPPIPNVDGNLLYFLSSRMPIFNNSGDVMGIVGISTDITQQKLTEQALAKANNIKSEFLANLSHDIRTPLTSIVALTEILARRIDNQELYSLAFDAKACAEEVLILIDEILEITDIEFGRLQDDGQVFNIAALFESIRVLLLTAAEQKGLVFSLDIDPGIPDALFGKRILLHRVLLNLVSNAIKFTNDGYVRLSVKLHRHVDNKVTLRIVVEDSGIGISDVNHQRIFEQFERLSPTYHSQYKGRGLGLYIVKKFIEIMQGSITVDSQVNQGSKFTVEVPLYISMSTQSKNTVITEQNVNQAEIEEHNLISLTDDKLRTSGISVTDDFLDAKQQNTLKVLLVEDTEVACKAAKVILNLFTTDVDIAKNGEIAVEKVMKNQYDIILLDIGLPDISGLEVARRIREHEKNENIVPVVIIALTAHLGPSAIQSCIQSGIQQTIRKPLSVARTHLLFSNWLSNIYNESNFEVNEVNVKLRDSSI